MTDSTAAPAWGDGVGLEDAASAIERLLTGTTENQADDDNDDVANAEDDSPEDDAEAHEADETSETQEEDAEADESEDDEEADADEKESREPLEPTDKLSVKIKVNGKEEVVDLKTLADGFNYNRVVTQKAQAVAEERKLVEAERHEINAARDEYGTLLHALNAKLADLSASEAEPDWQSLRQVDPLRYALERDAWREKQELKSAAEREMQRIQQERANEQSVNLRQFAEHQKSLALEARPVWKDKAAWSRDRDAMLAVGREIGLSDAELDKASIDHRVLLLLDLAAKGKRAMERSSKPAPKPQADPRSPPVSRPSGKTISPTPTNELTKSRMRLAKTGSVEDAADIFEQMFAARSASKKK